MITEIIRLGMNETNQDDHNARMRQQQDINGSGDGWVEAQMLHQAQHIEQLHVPQIHIPQHVPPMVHQVPPMAPQMAPPMFHPWGDQHNLL